MTVIIIIGITDFNIIHQYIFQVIYEMRRLLPLVQERGYRIGGTLQAASVFLPIKQQTGIFKKQIPKVCPLKKIYVCPSLNGM